MAQDGPDTIVVDKTLEGDAIISWPAVAGALEYNTYRGLIRNNSPAQLVTSFSS